MFNSLTSETWMAWGIGLLIGFPLLMILFGEMLHRLEGDKQERRAFLGNTQYFVLPSLVIYLLLTQVIGLEPEHNLVRVAATILWISVIYLTLAVFNLFWSGNLQDNTWQSRVPNLVLNIGRLFFIALGIAFVLSLVWGIDLGNMLAALGVGSIVLGLALQDTLGGLFAGITLISARQFQIGDWLKTGDVTGQVITVSWHSVTLRNFEDDLLVIPNSVLATGTFQNFSRPTTSHMERIIIGFCEEHPPNKVRAALLEAAKRTEGVLETPPPQIVLKELADDAGAFEAKIWFNDYSQIDAIRNAYLTNAWYAAKRHGIVFPYEDHQMYLFPGSKMKLGTDDSVALATLPETPQYQESFDLSADELTKLAADAEVLRFGKGEQVIQAGDEVDHIYVVLTGSSKSLVTDLDGRTHPLGNTESGNVFGLIPGLRHIESLVSVIAASDLQVAKIPVHRVEKLIKSNPGFGQDLELDIEQRLETINAIRFRGKDGKTKMTGIAMTHQGKHVVDLRELLSKKGGA